jgi:hypothetical protein
MPVTRDDAHGTLLPVGTSVNLVLPAIAVNVAPGRIVHALAMATAGAAAR